MAWPTFCLTALGNEAGSTGASGDAAPSTDASYLNDPGNAALGTADGTALVNLRELMLGMPLVLLVQMLMEMIPVQLMLGIKLLQLLMRMLLVQLLYAGNPEAGNTLTGRCWFK